MSECVQMFGCRIDAVDMPRAVGRVFEWLRQPSGRCRYVVTPNVHHTVLLQQHSGLQAAYRDAGMVLADGMPLIVAARLLGSPLPERVAGSDLVPALFEGWKDERSLRVYLLGAAAGVAERAAQNIHQRWPGVEVVGTYSPPFGFTRDPHELDAILSRVAEARADILVVGLGAPLQELWVHQHLDRIAAPVALCVGAAIDFLAGEKPRAPRWMRRTGLEWAHRVASEPRRLLGRYANDAWRFPALFWRELRFRQDHKSDVVPHEAGGAQTVAGGTGTAGLGG